MLPPDFTLRDQEDFPISLSKAHEIGAVTIEVTGKLRRSIFPTCGRQSKPTAMVLTPKNTREPQ